MKRFLLSLAFLTMGVPAAAAPPPASGNAGSAMPASAPTPPNPLAPAPTAQIAAAGILGRKVLGPDGKEIGRVVDVLVDAGSNPRAAVIDFGGFLGVGTRRVAVNWSDLTFPPTGSHADIKLDLTEDQISHAPAYKDQTAPAAVVEPPPIHASAAPPTGH